MDAEQLRSVILMYVSQYFLYFLALLLGLLQKNS